MVIPMQSGQILDRTHFASLLGSSLFKDLARDEIKIILELHLGRRRGEKDTQLVRAGDAAAPLLTITTGWAFRYCRLTNGRRQILSVHVPGDVIGLDTLLTGAPIYPVQCATAVTCFVIPRASAAELAQNAPWFRRRALDALARDRAAAQASLTRLGQFSAEERVVSVLLELNELLTARDLSNGTSFSLELTQQQLADLVGITPVHLNRVLKSLKARRLVKFDGHRVTLLDLPTLECMSLLARFPMGDQLPS